MSGTWGNGYIINLEKNIATEFTTSGSHASEAGGKELTLTFRHVLSGVGDKAHKGEAELMP